MRFRYRYVGFGTCFSREEGPRPEGEADPGKLYENELALDVGGVCLGHADVAHFVIDHHFYRQEGQFPAAAAAVLHLAPRIVDRFGGKDGDLWLVSHREPDFDAFSSMYLVRCLLEGTVPARDWESQGLRPDGWYHRRGEIDWFQPRVEGLSPDRRWPTLLAAYAACVDNGRRMACPKNRSLHSVLYAALARGREYGREDNGALEFFEEVRRTLEDPQKGLNPLIDSVLEESHVFAPERAMLDREVEAYRRDIRRARRAIVFLQESTAPFQEWFPEVQSLPLMKADGSLDPTHLRPPNQSRSQADGIYIRDPECLLFKEWARLDAEHSALGRGFLFTAVAYSRGRREAPVNQTDYYFSLDPERAERRHLYNVWARLQAEEARSCGSRSQSGPVRRGFESRASGHEAVFVDPWFDGHNYACTIVVTPNQGTCTAAAGAASDLSDDGVALLVQQELELSVFASDVTIRDLAVSASARSEAGHPLPVTEALKALSPPPRSCYRFARVELEDHVETLEAGMATQIGRVLWRVLDPDGSEGLPDEVLARHLVVDAESVSVWSRRGVVIAVKARSGTQAGELGRSFEALAGLARDVEALLEMPEDRVTRGEKLMRQIARLRHELALPQVRPLRSFFESSGLGELLGQVHDLNSAQMEHEQAERMGENIKTVADVQKRVHWIETFVVSVYAVELFHVLGVSFGFRHEYIAWGVVFAAAFTVVSIALVLHPWQHGGASRGMIVFLIAMAVILAGFVALGKRSYTGDEPRTAVPAAPPRTPMGAARYCPRRLDGATGMLTSSVIRTRLPGRTDRGAGRSPSGGVSPGDQMGVVIPGALPAGERRLDRDLELPDQHPPGGAPVRGGDGLDRMDAPTERLGDSLKFPYYICTVQIT